MERNEIIKTITENNPTLVTLLQSVEEAVKVLQTIPDLAIGLDGQTKLAIDKAHTILIEGSRDVIQEVLELNQKNKEIPSTVKVSKKKVTKKKSSKKKYTR